MCGNGTQAHCLLGERPSDWRLRAGGASDLGRLLATSAQSSESRTTASTYLGERSLPSSPLKILELSDMTLSARSRQASHAAAQAHDDTTAPSPAIISTLTRTGSPAHCIRTSYWPCLTIEYLSGGHHDGRGSQLSRGQASVPQRDGIDASLIPSRIALQAATGDLI